MLLLEDRKDKISKDRIQKLRRKARRDHELDAGSYRPSVVHRTSKTDQQRKKSNTIRPQDYDQ